jgi:hypothetical protein
MPSWAVEVHRLALEVHDRGPASASTGIFPSVIPQDLQSPDPTGTVETYNPDAPTDTRTNPFFQTLGSNGRACVTCHEPRSGWGVSAASIQQRFDESAGTDPIFRPVDGATCPSDDVSTLAARRTAYSLLQVFSVTDLGKAIISGSCADVGKVKGPILRGLAARAPYFHNGSAASLEDVVNLYDQRFGVGFTDQEKEDLIAFLRTL